MKTLLAFAFVLGIAAGASAQAPVRDRPKVATAGTAAITGTVVVDDERRAPLRRVLMTLSRAGTEDMRRSATDDAGRFTFSELPAGTYNLSASKGGYVSRNLGALQPGMPGSAITITDGSRFAAPPIALVRGGVIAGRLLDRHGRPVARARVEATQFVVVDGEHKRRSGSGASGSSQTNAHGEYRIFGLLPGDYLVYTMGSGYGSVLDLTTAELAWAAQPNGPMPPPGQTISYAPTAFPGTADTAGATPITLTNGEERMGVDFRVQSVPAVRISGSVSDPTGRPAPGTAVFRMPRRPGAFLTLAWPVTRADSDGTFVFTDTPPGDFLLVARASGARAATPQPVAPGSWGMAEVRVSGQDLTDVGIRLRPGMALSGRVTFSRGTTPIDFARIGVRLIGADPTTASYGESALVGADGSFNMSGLMPGAYRMAATIPPGSGVFARAALHAGTDIIDVPVIVRPNEDVTDVVLTLSDQPAELSGRLVDGTGQPTPQFYVFAFPTDKTAWVQGARRIASVRADLGGRYTLSPLIPGEYFLCALTEFETALQYDPTYLEQLVPASIKIAIGEGEKRVQDLRVGGGT